MKDDIRTLLLGAIAMLAVAAGFPKCAVADEGNNPFLGKPFFELQEIPCKDLATITMAADGTVLLFKDNRPKGVIEVRRSENGGGSWSEPVMVGELVKIEGDTFDDGRYTKSHYGRSILGNVIVDENNGDIMVFTSSMKPAPILYRSKDHGKTWKKEGILIKQDVNGWLPCLMATCEPGITLRYGEKKGRLLIATRVFVGYLNKGEGRKYYADHYSNAMYSDDGGKTWTSSAPFPLNGTGEAALAELSDGRIYYNSRTHLRPGNRQIAWSDDGGETWKDQCESEYLPDGPPDVYGCKGGLVRLPLDDRDILIYSSPGDPTAASTSRRADITVRVSSDGAKTWPVKRLVRKGPGGYTWLAAGRNETPSEGMIYLYCINGYLARFNLSWIAEGQKLP